VDLFWNKASVGYSDAAPASSAGEVYSLTFKDSVQAHVPVLGKELKDQYILDEFAREKRAAMRQGCGTSGPAATLHHVDEIR
jgi:hypothetical protein